MDSNSTKALFKESTVTKLLQEHFGNPKTKLNAEGSALVTEYLGLFVKEIISRAERQAKTEGDSQVEGSHLEKVIPQILLDFS